MYRDHSLSGIWDKFRKGDKEAFSDLFEKMSDRLFRYGIKFTFDEELVKDCVQELFIKLLRNKDNLPEVINPDFYLFRSLKHLLIDTIEQKEKIVYFSSEELPFHVKFIHDQNENKEYDEEIRERFEYVVNLLSDRQKEAIYLRYQHDMSYEEISKLLGVNYQSARNLIHRSLEKIRSEMDFNLFILLFTSLLE